MLPERVTVPSMPPTRRHQIHPRVSDKDADGNVGRLRLVVPETIDQRFVPGGEGTGRVRGKAQKQVYVHIGGKQGGVTDGRPLGGDSCEGAKTPREGVEIWGLLT